VYTLHLLRPQGLHKGRLQHLRFDITGLPGWDYVIQVLSVEAYQITFGFNHLDRSRRMLKCKGRYSRQELVEIAFIIIALFTTSPIHESPDVIAPVSMLLLFSRRYNCGRVLRLNDPAH
jgi:hypothetical protein